jgi:hypothetical protein
MRTPEFHLVRKAGRIDDDDVEVWSQTLDSRGDCFAIRARIIGHHQA